MSLAANAFNNFMDSVCDVVPPAAFNTWFSKVSGRAENGTITLSAPNKFVASCLKNKYMDSLRALAAEMQMGLEISSSFASAPVAPVNDNAPVLPIAPAAQTAQADGCAFDSFIMSAENEFAVAAAKRVASGAAGFQMLYLCGAFGSGKTHLARAIKNSAVGMNVVMMSGDGFASDFIRALRDKNAFAFKDKIIASDILIIDGLESLLGKRACLDEFESLLVALIERGGRAVLTAASTPAALTGLPRRLQSVLSSGIVADVAAPNSYVKINMLKSTGVPNDLAEFAAKNSEDNGHITSGLAKKISAWREAFGADMTLSEATRALSGNLSTQNSPEGFVSKMCGALGVSMEDISSSRRNAKIVRARQMMMFVLRSDTKLSLSEIGRLLGNKDHATILYGIKCIEKQKLNDLTLMAEIDMLRNACKC
ncbi:MAG: AAA family ATPase [Rickettsiales bacterium]|jgi:chromosomal replication initiator protein|nr:AAA family ATPase [Rickettsiales bacterium]